jgi:hypothetical protein
MYDKDKMGAAVLEGVIATIDDGLKDAGMLLKVLMYVPVSFLR